MAVAIINLDIDRPRHESADVLALAMLCIYCHLCIIVLIIGLESHGSAFDILNSKRLLQCGGEPHAHSLMPEDHCWESFSCLNAWDLQELFVELFPRGALDQRKWLIYSLHIEERFGQPSEQMHGRS